MRRWLDKLLLVALSLLLVSCGYETMLAEGGIGGTGIAMGRVSQIGSVYVNGIHYNTDNTVFIINGSAANNGLADIGVGMVVRVTGSTDNTNGTGVADQVAYDSLLVGPVDTLFDATESHIGVMRQAVHINDDTVLEDKFNDPPLAIEEMPIGTIVEVSGYASTPGEILATRIEVKSDTGVYKVTGSVSAADPVSDNFTIGGLIIDASAVTEPLPEVGSFVLVEGSMPPNDGNFIAGSVVPVQTDGWAPDGEELSLEGVITTRLDPTTHLFSVNGQSVDATYTPYSIDEMALAAGRMVHVDGIMNGGVLLALEIELDATNTVRETIATVLQDDAVDLGGRTVTLMNKTVHITNSTIFENDRYGESTFSLDELQAGDYLTAKVIDNNGELTATKLELDDVPYSYDAYLKGTPSDLGGGQIEILGVTVDTSGIGGYTFASTRIKVKGSYDPATQVLTATSIVEDEHHEDDSEEDRESDHEEDD